MFFSHLSGDWSHHGHPLIRDFPRGIPGVGQLPGQHHLGPGSKFHRPDRLPAARVFLALHHAGFRSYRDPQSGDPMVGLCTVQVR